MSVINEMLKDLDKRKSEQNQSVDGREVSYVKVNEPDVKLIIIAILVTAIVCVGLMFVLFDQKDKPRYIDVKNAANQQAEQQQNRQQPSTKTLSKNTVSLVDNDANASHQPVQDMAEETGLVAVQKSTSQPLQTSSKATTKLQVVADESKITHFQAENSKIVANPPVAVDANTIAVKTTVVKPQIEAETNIVAANPQITVAPSTVVVKEGEEPQSSRKASKEITPTEPSLVIAPVKLSAKELAHKKLNQAKRSIKAHRIDEAEALFEEAIMLQPKASEARKQLAALWFGRGANNQAKNLLKQGLMNDYGNEDYRIMLARIYASENNYNKAYEALNELPNSSRIEYLLALANMASQSGHHDTAITTYQSLLVIKPIQSQWWLGLAISLDSNEQYEQAVVAYQKALYGRGLPKTSADFAKQRLVEIGE